MKVLMLVWFICYVGLSQGLGQIQDDSLVEKGLTRERLFFSVGLGGTVVNANTDIDSRFARESGSGRTNIGVAISLRAGYAINTHWAIYCQRLQNRVSEKIAIGDHGNYKFSYGLTGLGTTYYRKSTSPSQFYNASIGLATRRDIEIGETGTGVGFSLGSGYQFANRWSIEANIIYGNAKESDYWQSQFWSTQITVNYLWFKSFQEARLKKVAKTFYNK